MRNSDHDPDALDAESDFDSTRDAADDAIENTNDAPVEPGGGLWGLGFGATLVVVGLGLVVFPEPATTAVGIVLVGAGLGLAVLEALG